MVKDENIITLSIKEPESYYEEITDEILCHLQFYIPHNSKTGAYQFRPYGDIEKEKTSKLVELYGLLSEIIEIMFHYVGANKLEQIFYLDEYELSFHDADSLEPSACFALGVCWGEYLTMFGKLYHEDWDREIPKYKGKDSYKVLSNAVYREGRYRYGQTKGAKGNSNIGVASKKAYREFVLRNFPDGLNGRTKAFAYTECLTQIEAFVKLERKLALGVDLSVSEEKKHANLSYLVALTKNKNGELSPYKLNALKTKLSPLLKK